MEVIKTAHNKIIVLFEAFIYGGRWAMVPMYVGLLATLGIYVWRFLVQLLELCHQSGSISEGNLMLAVLGLVDLTMIGNLIVMIMIGSYSIFVRPLGTGSTRPQWLEHISSGTLKVKIGTSLIGITSVHLLKDFVDSEALTREQIIRHVGIHLIFVISTLCLAFTDKVLHATTPHATTTPETTHVH